MGSAMDGLKKVGATWYKGSFGYNAELATGVAMGENFLPIKMIGQPEGNLTYMEATRDQAVLLQLLSARNLKRVKLFVEQEENLNFMVDLLNLQSAAIPFKATIGVSRWAFGKRVAVYILRDANAQLLMTPAPHLVKTDSGRIWVFQISLPPADIVEGNGDFAKMKKIR